jgi:glycosyltransferase involved in cell wall biosynthesis
MPSAPKPRVGLDVRLAYYTAGGISRYIRHLAAELPAREPAFDYTQFYHRRDSATFSPLARRVNCWTPAHHQLERLALAAEIMPYRLDLLHSPDFIPPLAGYRRSIITVHDLTFLLYPQFLTAESRRYYNDQIRWAVKRCDAISADSHATKADLTRLLDVAPDKITVIHLGLEPVFSPDEPAGDGDAERLMRLKLAPGYLLFVGTFEPRKNVSGLLRAYAALRRRWPDAPDLVLAGRQGWLFDSMVVLIQELRLASCTHFLAEVAEADLPALYRQAKAFVLPSYYEGFGFTLLEAMGCGTPAVVANRASLPEIAGDAAILVEPDDAESIADALYRTMTDNAQRAQMRQRGLERAAQFTWERTAQDTLDLYHRVLSK